MGFGLKVFQATKSPSASYNPQHDISFSHFLKKQIYENSQCCRNWKLKSFYLFPHYFSWYYIYVSCWHDWHTCIRIMTSISPPDMSDWRQRGNTCMSLSKFSLAFIVVTVFAIFSPAFSISITFPFLINRMFDLQIFYLSTKQLPPLQLHFVFNTKQAFVVK